MEFHINLSTYLTLIVCDAEMPIPLLAEIENGGTLKMLFDIDVFEDDMRGVEVIDVNGAADDR